MSQNIRELMASGRPQKQSVAIALDNARRHPKAASGGIVPRRAFGGPSGSTAPWWERREASSEVGGSAFLHSPVAGRTDHLPISPAAGSYVLPAEVVSGLGEGNSLAGARVVEEMLRSAPFGTAMPRGGHGSSIPRAPRPMQEEAKGGGVQSGAHGRLTPILAAGGEIVLHPRDVMKLASHAQGRSVASLKEAHDVLDAWVKYELKKHAETLRNLPGPVKQ